MKEMTAMFLCVFLGLHACTVRLLSAVKIKGNSETTKQKSQLYDCPWGLSQGLAGKILLVLCQTGCFHYKVTMAINQTEL